MIGISIRTRLMPIAFVIACFSFALLFSLFYGLIFRSIDEIFARQSVATLQEVTNNIEASEEQFIRASKKLYIGRGIQRLFSKIANQGSSQAVQNDLREILDIWYRQQDRSYIAATYMDKLGTPLVAINFLGTQAKSGSVENLTRSAETETSDRHEYRQHIDSQVIQTWTANDTPLLGTYALRYPSNEFVLRSVFPIFDRKSREKNGFFAIDRPLKDIIGQDLKTGERLLLIDEANDRVVFDSSNIENSNFLFSDYYSEFATAQYLPTEGDVPPYAKCTVDTKEILLTRINIKKLGWNIFHLNILDAFLHSPKQRGKILVIGALIFVTVTGAAIYILTKRVQRRSRDLEEANSDLEKANDIVSTHSRMLEQELQTAHDMQMRLMPVENPTVNGFDIVGSCRPATEVGGDFYQYYPLQDGRIAITLADVTGHGMQAAVPTMVFSGLLDTQIGYTSTPQELMPRLNSSLHRILEPRTFVCFTVGELDSEHNRVRLSNGGCPYPYIFRANTGKVEEIALGALPLGIRAGSIYPVVELTLERDDVLVMCSDGIIEAADGGGELFGFERTSEAIRHGGVSRCSGEEFVEHIFHEIETFTDGYLQEDDQTLVVIRSLKDVETALA